MNIACVNRQNSIILLKVAFGIILAISRVRMQSDMQYADKK